MIRHHPIPWRHLTRAALLLALAVGVAADRARANPEALSAAELEKQAYAKIVEARGSARAERYPDALTRLDDAVTLAEQLDDKLPLALALHNKGEVELLRGRPLDALKAYYRVLGIYRRLGHEAGAALAQKRIGMLTRLVKKPEKPAAPSQEEPAAKTPDRLSPIDQAVERIRARVRSAGQKPPEVPAAPVEARRTGEPPVPVEAPVSVPTTPPEEPAASAPATPDEKPPGRAPAAGTEEPRQPSVQVARAEPPSAADNPREWAYVESLKRKIGGRSRYPAYARRTGQQGTVALVLAVRENGQLAGVELSESSGFIVLDVEALRNVRESAPFGPVPVRATPGPLTVRLTISYKLPAASDPAP